MIETSASSEKPASVVGWSWLFEIPYVSRGAGDGKRGPRNDYC